MAAGQSLAHRFAFGSNYSARQEHEIVLGTTRNVKDIRDLQYQFIKNQKQALEQFHTAYSEQTMVLKEIGRQISSLEASFSKGFADMTDAIYHLEDAICAELSEIKWVLGSVDSKVAELVHLNKMPGETAAIELIGHGVKALKAGNYDHAEKCLLKAVNEHITSFQAHTYLGFTFLHRENAEGAIKHFKYAADYAPEIEGKEIYISALENLARVHFVVSDYTKACSLMEEALDLRKEQGNPSLRSKYKYATYCAQAGEIDKPINLIVDLCKIDPDYMRVASMDEDLALLRGSLLVALDELRNSENKKGIKLLALAETKYAECFSELSSNPYAAAADFNRLLSLLALSRRRLDAGNYVDSVRAVIACESVMLIISYLPKVLALHEQLEAGKKQEARAHAELNKASKRVDNEEERVSAARYANRQTEQMLDSSFASWMGCAFVVFGAFVGGGIGSDLGHTFLGLVAGIAVTWAAAAGFYVLMTSSGSSGYDAGLGHSTGEKREREGELRACQAANRRFTSELEQINQEISDLFSSVEES